MTAQLLDLRERLAASITLPQDEIDLRAALEDRRSEINAILLRLRFIAASERKPGRGTARAMELIARELWLMADSLREQRGE